MKVLAFLISVSFLLTSNAALSQGNSGITSDIQQYKKEQEEARKKRAATEASLKAHREREKRAAALKEKEERQKAENNAKDMRLLQSLIDNPTYGVKNCNHVFVKITKTDYSDKSSSYTLTRSDGSTQNIFTGPNHDGPTSYGTSGTASHAEFVREASQVKEANGVSTVRSGPLDFR